jgi:hypothetical protein
MDYFRRVLTDIDLAPLLQEIEENEEAWLANTTRQDQIPIQRETQTIGIRDPIKCPDLEKSENQESEWSKLSESFPLACKFMSDVAQAEGGELSRAAIVRLKPKGNVYLHTDLGSYYLIRNRYHLVLKSDQGSILMSGGETVRMKEGELWWFDNLQYHQAMNNSEDWRIHFIFDVLPKKYADLGKNPLTPNEVKERLTQANLLKAKK